MKKYLLENNKLETLIDKFHGAPYHHKGLPKNPFVDETHVEPTLEEFKKYMLSGNKLDYDFSGKSCAIIGSSPMLLDKEYGKEIDKYDYVVRCNEGEIEGYEKHVGSKTDFRMIGKKTFTNQNLEAGGFPSRWNWFPKLKNEHFLLRPLFGNDLMKYKSILDCLQQFNGRKDIRVSFVEDKLEQEVLDKTNHLGSTGFCAILLFSTLVDCIDIYGFDHHLASDTVQYYFLQTNTKTSVQTHNFNGEKDFCSELEKIGKLRRHG